MFMFRKGREIKLNLHMRSHLRLLMKLIDAYFLDVLILDWHSVSANKLNKEKIRRSLNVSGCFESFVLFLGLSGDLLLRQRETSVWAHTQQQLDICWVAILGAFQLLEWGKKKNKKIQFFFSRPLALLPPHLSPRSSTVGNLPNLHLSHCH